jgi:hypothetical protein
VATASRFPACHQSSESSGTQDPCWCTPPCFVWLLGESSLDTNFAATLCMPKSLVKIPFVEPQPIPTSSAISMSTLCQWRQHFGSLMVSWNAGHCPPTCSHL